MLLCPGAFNSGFQDSLKSYSLIIACTLQSLNVIFIAGCYCTDNDPISCPIGRCECEGQIRVNHDCTEAR